MWNVSQPHFPLPPSPQSRLFKASKWNLLLTPEDIRTETPGWRVLTVEAKLVFVCNLSLRFPILLWFSFTSSILSLIYLLDSPCVLPDFGLSKFEKPGNQGKYIFGFISQRTSILLCRESESFQHLQSSARLKLYRIKMINKNLNIVFYTIKSKPDGYGSNLELFDEIIMDKHYNLK